MHQLIRQRCVRAVLPRAVAALFVVPIVILKPVVAMANHGPGTSGGGISTPSGEVLKPGSFELTLQQDYTQFEHVSRGAAERRSLRAGEFDALENASVTSPGLSYGLLQDLQIPPSIGYSSGKNFIAAEPGEDGTADSGVADPSGLTDLSLTAKWRVMRGQ